MTGANRVSSLYASVAEAGEDADADAFRAAAAGAEHRAGPAAAPPPAGAGGSVDGAPAPTARRGQGSEQELPAGTKLRGRTVTAASAVPRKVLLRRAALAGAVIVLLGLGLIVSEDNLLAPAEALVPDASTADAAADASAATASTPAVAASASIDLGADGTPSAAVAPEPEGEGASNDVAAQPEAAQADAPRSSNLPGAAREDATQAETSQTAAASAEISQAETARVGITASETTQPAAAEPEAAQGTMAPVASTAAPAPAASARALAQGYIVQLGVFGDPDNAAILSRELAARGYPAHLQSRVVLGPFPDRQAAKAAAERLRGERKLEGIVVPPRKP